MSDYVQKPNSGALFRNDKRETETHPDYRGNAIIDGVDYWVSAWINTAQLSGKKYMAMRFDRKEVQPQAPAAAPMQPAAPAAGPDFDADVPF